MRHVAVQRHQQQLAGGQQNLQLSHRSVGAQQRQQFRASLSAVAEIQVSEQLQGGQRW